MKAFHVIAKFLAHERAGKPVFGLMGDANLAFLGAFIEAEKGNYVGAVREGGAVSMAEGYARMSGEVGVASVTHGPALTNTLTELTEAARGRAPIVVIYGDTPTHNEHFQYFDSQAFARAAGAHYERVLTPELLVTTMRKAFLRARLDSVPVLLDIPFPLMKAELEWTPPALTHAAPQAIAPDTDAVDEALGLLMSAKRPFVLAGRGAVAAGARDAILALARKVNAPVLTSLLAKQLFEGEPENLGIHGTLSTPAAIEYMGEADVVLSLGASLNNWQTDHYQLLEGKQVIQSDIDPAAIAKFGPVAQAVVGDARLVSEAMVARLDEIGHEPRRAAYLEKIAQTPFRESRDLFVPHTGDGFVDMRHAALTLSEALPQGTVNITDVGRFCYSVWPHIDVTPGRWHYAGYFGSIGLGIAEGVGAALAVDDAPTVVWAGDGGSMQGLLEISTAVRAKAPLLVVVMNDQCYGAEYGKLQAVGWHAETSFLEWPSFAESAAGLGAETLRVTSAQELEAAAARVSAWSAESVAGDARPLLIEVVADAHKVSIHPAVVPLEK